MDLELAYLMYAVNTGCFAKIWISGPLGNLGKLFVPIRGHLSYSSSLETGFS